MFSGNLLLCDYLTRLHDGKFMLVGLYNSIIVQGPERKHDFTFFSQITTDIRGNAQGRVRFFYRGEGPECVKPLVDITFPMEFHENKYLPDVVTGDFPFQIPQATLGLNVDARIKGEDVIIPYVAVLSIGEHEVARMLFTVQFILKPGVTVTRI